MTSVPFSVQKRVDVVATVSPNVAVNADDQAVATVVFQMPVAVPFNVEMTVSLPEAIGTVP